MRRKLDRRFRNHGINLSKRLLLIISLVIVLLILCSIIIYPSLISNQKEVKVLIYNGSETSDNSVNNIQYCLNVSNEENYTSNIKFVYNTSDKIDEEVLSSYDVLIMPGTDTGFDYDYISSESVDGNAIKNFVREGHGFVGICAGAYSGVNSTDNWNQGWGIAPHVNAKQALNEGNITIKFTTAGKQVLGYEDQQVISHIYGPALYTTQGNATVLAVYSDNGTGYIGYDAIVGDYYGEGRVVLSGVHPELDPKDPELLAYLILWAANLNNTTED